MSSPRYHLASYKRVWSTSTYSLHVLEYKNVLPNQKLGKEVIYAAELTYDYQKDYINIMSRRFNTPEAAIKYVFKRLVKISSLKHDTVIKEMMIKDIIT